MQVNFPLVKGSDGYFKRLPDTESVKQRLAQMMLTNPGERVGVPAFGAGIRKFLFEPLDSDSFSAMKDAIRNQIIIFEPSLAVERIDIWADYNLDPPLVYIRLTVMDMRQAELTQYDFTIKYRNPLFR